MTAPFAYRGPDGDLNLEEALGPHLRHYVGVMVSGADGTRAWAIAEGRVLDDAGVQEGRLVRFGYGQPTRASSCGDVAVQPSWVWDACAYYFRLRVHWSATRRELRLAYLALDPQEQDTHLKYCLIQLMDPVIRRAYDRVPLGGVFLWDRDIAAQIKRAAAAESARRMSEGTEATIDDVMDEMGFRQRPREEVYEEAREPSPEASRQLPEASEQRWTVRWGHYVLHGPQGFPAADPAALEAWQGAVAAALRGHGIVTGFAVAQGSEGDPLVLRNINEPCIFVLTEKGTSPEKASEAVEMGITLRMVTDSSQGGI